MQFLQKQKNRSEFVIVDNAESATHIITNRGELHLLTRTPEMFNDNEFDDNEQVPEPLSLPTMNFGEEKEKEKTSNVNNGDLPEGLPLPVMKF